MEHNLAPMPAPPPNERRRRPHRLLQFDLLVRVSILFSSTITCLLAWFVPQSLTAVLLAGGAEMGRIVLIVMTGAVAIGYADVIINDMLPDRYSLPMAKHLRHLGYSLLAALYLLQAYVSVGNSLGPEDLLPFGYALNALMAAWYSWTTAIRGWHV
jgi:hypothetical protein